MLTAVPGVSDVIASMKLAAGVATDTELAGALGIERSAIAKWKARGAVPERYLLALPLPGGGGRFSKYINALRARIFSRPKVHYLLRAALAVLSQDDLPTRGDLASQGSSRELVLLLLMDAAQIVSMKVLGKRCPVTEEEFQALVSAIEAQGAGWKAQALSAEVVSQWGLPSGSW